MVDLQALGALPLHVGPVDPRDVHPPTLRVGGDLLVVVDQWKSRMEFSLSLPPLSLSTPSLSLSL